ncbi:hypothetical protein OKA05_10410 [Luteolibacter arcticus]|uniref:Uncharacterized protein n=1 Tax=Luteolibacter arcticus TaxID=1581411 RepID=A0ABT3GH71_9BACT|nr:hypothetical protein [Luteolibacter arcticus]MCW1922964.1 hypothetical protein [Luteolibacter arcticus]
MRRWWLLPGLIGIVWLGSLLGMGFRWDITWARVSDMGRDELLKLAWRFGAASLFLGWLVFFGATLVFRRIEWPARRTILVLGVASLVLGVWSGFWPLWKLDRRHQVAKREEGAQNWARSELPRLRKEGKYPEMVEGMERVLAVHEETIAEVGLYPLNHNHGFSYLFVYMYPASYDLPPRLGSGLTEFLYDAWYDPGWDPTKKGVADDLSKAMTASRHPLLRAIGYCVNRDYVSFEREALAGARAGDERMSAMALTAACGGLMEREVARQAVGAILDRGQGLGWDRGGSYAIPSSRIRDYVEGRIPREYLGNYPYFPSP